MNETEILTAFHLRRAHYDTYLRANDIHLYTCPGCGFPTLPERNRFEICEICDWEDDGEDDHANSMITEVSHPRGGPNGNLSLKDNRINIGRILESHIELKDGEVDFDTASVLKTIEYYQRRKEDISNRMTGDESAQDHIRFEWKEVRNDLLAAMVVPKL
ncbi:CPCC family cysteine-rich protein [Chitinophaga sancti]|uniref:CPCC family cysteine-rich protein n=1 Tax=Chitinophaga sancti TaxID=1004 RepID=A0A1K1R9Z4_9BACT|nr:CPCC family cysteine-rich protein [Chitinophaga sancti]WQD65529.1 CPCC family cysteine-rich protein [Chitinophaga sancti]WQG88848.1 CPCC family cysteine-rich protein [Chitinophaga sancti]SFW68959.1 Cysteine-rich CPCC [Chitinophaga sancti]